jgi:hypothetical protein
MKKLSLFVLALTITGLVFYGMSVGAQSHSHSRSQSTTTSSSNAGVAFKPSPAVKAKAALPQPGPNAQQKMKKDSIGEGKALITTTDSNNDFWIEAIDLSGKGQKSDAQMLWDNTEKILYTYANQKLTCKNGQTADGNLLMAVYGTGNTAKMPVGSGWWAAGLNENECAMKTEGLYACKFDAKGNNTTCGVAELDEKTHELTFVEASTTENR